MVFLPHICWLFWAMFAQNYCTLFGISADKAITQPTKRTIYCLINYYVKWIESYLRLDILKTKESPARAHNRIREAPFFRTDAYIAGGHNLKISTFHIFWLFYLPSSRVLFKLFKYPVKLITQKPPRLLILI